MKILLLALPLGACAVFASPPPAPEYQKPAVLVRWDTVSASEVQSLCGGTTTRMMYGCEFDTDYGCQIFVPEMAPDEVLGHEVRHCFEGAFHD